MEYQHLYTVDNEGPMWFDFGLMPYGINPTSSQLQPPLLAGYDALIAASKLFCMQQANHNLDYAFIEWFYFNISFTDQLVRLGNVLCVYIYQLFCFIHQMNIGGQ